MRRFLRSVLPVVLALALATPGMAQDAKSDPSFSLQRTVQNPDGTVSQVQQFDDSPAFAVEFGVMSPRDPTAAFGLIVGEGTMRSYSRFGYKADGTVRQVETGVERVVYSSARFDLVSRAVAGIVQDENNSSGTVAAQFGPLVRLPWGLAVSALAEGGNAPVRDGEWRGGASLTLRWTPK